MVTVCAEGFRKHFGRAPESTYFAPGRINLIGEHTDYNGGLVLPAAIELGTCFATRRKDSPDIRVVSRNFADEFTIALRDLDDVAPAKHWKDYFVGVLVQLAGMDRMNCGLDVFVSSSLPPGRGLSSSASVTTGFAYLLCDIWDLPLERPALASIAQAVENDFVGVGCGILDPFSVLMGEEGQLMALDCSSMAMRYVPFPIGQYQVISVDSRVSRNLSDSDYNRRRSECEQALARFRKHADLQNLSELTVADLDDIRHVSDSSLMRRARHVVTENNRVRAAVDALATPDMHEFGRLLSESHRSLRDDFEVSCSELDLLVEESLRIPGAIGAKMTGAGFGGCIVAVVDMDARDGFVDELSARYRAKTGVEAGFNYCNPARGVHRTQEAGAAGEA